MKQVKDLNKSYILVDRDIDVSEIQEDFTDMKNPFKYLFVKLDKSKADYQEIYGSDSCNLDAYVFLIYTTNFNNRKNKN